MMHPWRSGELGLWQGTLVIAAQTGMGKSRVALEYAVRAMREAVDVLCISREISEDELHGRMSDIRRARNLSPPGDFITRRYDRSWMGVAATFADRCKLIVLDEPEDQGQVETTFNTLKQMTKQWGTSFVVTRGVVRKKMSLPNNGLPVSDQVAHSADVIISLEKAPDLRKGKPPVFENEDQMVDYVERRLEGHRPVLVNIVKNREGAQGKFVIDLKSMEFLGYADDADDNQGVR